MIRQPVAYMGLAARISGRLKGRNAARAATPPFGSSSPTSESRGARLSAAATASPSTSKQPAAMADYSTDVAGPSRHPVFTQMVVSAMRQLFPEEWADKSWDNVGLLLGNLQSPRREEKPIVLLTNDLTPQVGVEASSKGASVIVSYHPIIFRPLRAITADDWQQRLLLHLVQHNIAVYSPHTAADAAADGLNDWLCDVAHRRDEDGPLVSRTVLKPLPPPTAAATAADPVPAHTAGVGYGRRCELARPIALGVLIRRLADGLGGLKHVLVARPRFAGSVGSSVSLVGGGGGAPPPAGSDSPVRSFAVCVGSGGDVLRDAPADTDVLITGELAHHAALRATMRGQTVVAVLHSNSERGFLAQRLRPLLERALRETEPAARVLVSEMDAEPFEIWSTEGLGGGPYAAGGSGGGR